MKGDMKLIVLVLTPSLMVCGFVVGKCVPNAKLRGFRMTFITLERFSGSHHCVGFICQVLYSRLKEGRREGGREERERGREGAKWKGGIDGEMMNRGTRTKSRERWHGSLNLLETRIEILTFVLSE